MYRGTLQDSPVPPTDNSINFLYRHKVACVFRHRKKKEDPYLGSFSFVSLEASFERVFSETSFKSVSLETSFLSSSNRYIFLSSHLTSSSFIHTIRRVSIKLTNIHNTPIDTTNIIIINPLLILNNILLRPDTLLLYHLYSFLYSSNKFLYRQ